MKAFHLSLAKTLGFEAVLTMMKLLYLGIMLLDTFHLRQKPFKTSCSAGFLINARETVLWGIQTLANKGVNNLIKQMAIFNHKNKI